MTLAGNSRLLKFDTWDAEGAPANAGSLTLTVTDPTGNVTTPGVAPDEERAGHYEYPLALFSAGFWQWTWVASGAPATPRAESGATFVAGRESPHHAWCSVEDVLETSPMRKALDTITKGKSDAPLNLELVQRSALSATEYLHSRTWRRFGSLVTAELRPCCSCGASPIFGLPGLSGPALAWLAWPMASYLRGDPLPIIDGPASCACHRVSEVLLPADTQAVLSVMIDGAPFSAYRLDSGRRLIRTDGDHWPCCSRIDLPDSQDDTFSVHIVAGREEPELARLACSELASELYLGIADPSACRIPTRVKTVQRAGSTYTVVDQTTIAKDGSLGLRITDIFLQQFGKRRRRMVMASPDVSEPTRRVNL